MTAPTATTTTTAKITAKIIVTLKPGVLDPQGLAIQNALGALGFGGVAGVRMGKYLELDLAEADPEAARAAAEQMCQKLLANMVIEKYRVEIG